MSSIKRLQRSVHNSLHSSIILFDLPRVVEELTYNSVDAGSTKVYVSLSVRACYVKVEDDGCGITRDGLVILGEQYATSKNHLMAGTEASSESLGIRGEALASLSDVSLVEVRTKARGNPNAYCKIMKGSKCLFLGIDDQREAVGTTVIVRDLFYNQPVRRKYMQSSPKKVLHSVKKCILRIALVHPELSFKVTDTDIEAELLCTVPSSSPLPLVSDGFGCEVSNSLHEIVFSDQTWRLAGYLSGPADFFSSKAFQYLYINSRFVSKGSIHNLLNSLGARSSSSLVQRKVNPEFSSGKRHKSQGYPAYLLNLRCPLSCYDITYEPSKTVAEFKDWDAVLSFFERAITHFWQQRPTISLHGKPINHENILHSESELQKNEFFRSSKATRKRKCNIQFHQNSPLSSCLDISSENVNVRHGKTLRGMHRSLELKQCQTSRHGQTAYSVGKKIQDSEDALASPHAQLDFPNSNTHLWTPDVNSFPPECHSVSDHPISVKRKYDISPIEWERECPGDCRNLKDDSTSDPYGIIDDAQEEEFLLACPNGFSKVDREIYSLMENEQNSSIYDKNFGDSDFDHFEKDFLLGDAVDVSCGSYSTETLKYRDTLFEGDLHTSRQRSFNVTGKFHTARKPDVWTNYSVSPFSHDEVCLPQNNYLSNRLGWTVSSIYGFHEAEIHLGLSDSFSSSVDNFTEGCASRDNLRLFSGIDSSDSDVEEKFDFLHSIQNCSVEVPPSTRHTNTKLDYKYRNTPRRDMQYGCPSKVNLGELPSSGILSDRDWSLDSPNMKSIDSYDNSFFNFTVKNVGDVVETQWAEEKFENCRSSKIKKVRSRRSCSAPPFYKGTRKFVILNGHLSTVEGKGPLSECSKDAKMSEDNTNTLDYLSQPYCASQPCLQPTLGDASMKHLRGCIDEKLSSHEVNGMQNVDGSDNVRHNRSSHTNAVEGSTYDDWEHAPTTLTKWRPGVPQPTVGDMSYPNPKHKDDILDISSGLLHLSGGSLVPESIDKDNLEDARVLLQLDKKFIPVMARGTLVIIDQHAADERIRLEELRRKVLSGEGNSITYLDSELELVLPEMGFQLLQKYAEQVKKWGWICSIHSQCSQESFAKNVNLLKRRACGATLVAVPCILGINLTDKDLIEFIEQLVETDGSSTLPPSVLRILNYKACRGAIMFGDSLLPSECSLIVEELKATSLCFQCAHGRPTTVPLLNMKALYEQLDKLDMQSGRPEEVWHGLRQHAPTLERARMRLESAKRFHNG